MATAITSEVTSETRGKRKNQQRSRVAVRSVATPAGVLWDSGTAAIRALYAAGDEAGLEMRQASWANMADHWEGPNRNVAAMLSEYAEAATDLLTGDSGAAKAGPELCPYCHRREIDHGAVSLCAPCATAHLSAFRVQHGKS